MKGWGFLDWLSNCLVLKKGSAPWIYLLCYSIYIYFFLILNIPLRLHNSPFPVSALLKLIPTAIFHVGGGDFLFEERFVLCMMATLSLSLSLFFFPLLKFEQ
jgi:hypothetical protein